MVKIFADGANLEEMLALSKDSQISGLTTNPSLLKKAGVTDYRSFATGVLSFTDKPVSFEVISDDIHGMYEQGFEIASWGKNVYVKIPITNTKGVSTYNVVELLTQQGKKVNVTAIMTIEQVREILPALKDTQGAYISVFGGRIADTGVDPLPLMKKVLKLIKGTNIELIWASPREVFNIMQAHRIGCHIITCTPDILKKMNLLGKNLTEYSRQTVEMFYNDAKESGLRI